MHLPFLFVIVGSKYEKMFSAAAARVKAREMEMAAKAKAEELSRNAQVAAIGYSNGDALGQNQQESDEDVGYGNEKEIMIHQQSLERQGRENSAKTVNKTDTSGSSPKKDFSYFNADEIHKQKTPQTSGASVEKKEKEFSPFTYKNSEEIVSTPMQQKK